MAERTVLAGDIGGSNVRLRAVRGSPSARASRTTLAEGKFRTDSFGTTGPEGFASGIAHFLRERDLERPDACCIAAAGPVQPDSSVSLTNAGITIASDALAHELYLSNSFSAVINDFEAIGYGVLTLPPSVLLHVNGSRPQPSQPIVVIGSGTGLGEAVLTFDSGLGDYAVWPSEGAHCAFGAVGQRQRELAASIEHELGECEVEHICSGSGLERLCAFTSSGSLHLSAADVVSRASDGDSSCGEAIELFLSALGQEAASLALKVLASGGVYIAGGIPPKLGESRLLDGTLRNAFESPSSRFASLRASFPLQVVNTSDSVGLRGAAEYAFRTCA
jgi:glucokinase